MNFEFMTIDTPLPPCMPFPRALTGFPVSSTAKVMYCRMLDAMLSKGQEDENGILFALQVLTLIATRQRVASSSVLLACPRCLNWLLVQSFFLPYYSLPYPILSSKTTMLSPVLSITLITMCPNSLSTFILTHRW